MDPSLVRAINEFPILSYAQAHLKLRGGQAGQFIRADCFHCGGKRTLSISKEKKYFLCFRCKEGGYGHPVWRGTASLVSAISAIESIPWQEAVVKVRSLAGLPEAVYERAKSDVLVPPEAIPLCLTSEDEPAVLYLQERKVEHLIEICSVIVSGGYAERVVIPCYSGHKLIGSELKSIAGAEPKTLYYPDGIETGDYLYTATFAKPSKEVVLVESIIDAESFKGIHDSVLALFGANLTEAQTAALENMGVTRLVWCLDGDAKAKVAKNITRRTFDRFENFFVEFPKTEDPNSLLVKGELEAWLNPKKIETEWDLLSLML